jgi:hypothetical protein
MDTSLRKKMLYVVCAGIIVLFVVIALLFLFRKPQNEKIITRTEYLAQTPSNDKPSADVKAFLPPLSSTQSAHALADRNDTSSSQPLNDSTTTSSTPPTSGTTTTTTTSVSKAWSFFRQSVSLPWIFLVATFPSASSCGKANQPICPVTPGNVTYVTNETQVTHITFVQEVVDIPLSILDSLQDIIFYKFIELLQQSVLANDRYPVQQSPTSASWLTQLIATGEMRQFYYDVFKSTNPESANCGSALQQGFCYESNGTSANLYIRMKAGTQQCPKGAIKTWNSDKDALQVTCF